MYVPYLDHPINLVSISITFIWFHSLLYLYFHFKYFFQTYFCIFRHKQLESYFSLFHFMYLICRKRCPLFAKNNIKASSYFCWGLTLMSANSNLKIVTISFLQQHFENSKWVQISLFSKFI